MQQRNLLLQFVALDVLIPSNRGELVTQFYQFGTIERESYEADGTHVRGYIPANHSGPFAAFAVQPEISKRLRA